MQQQELESLIVRAFDPVLPPNTKRDAEATLTSFRSQPDAWRQCIYLLGNTRVPVVQFYALSVVEHAILTGWFRIAESDRLQLRSFLLEMLSTRHASLERYVMNKLCKTIVDIGKFEWPMNFPDLLPFTQQLIQRPDTSALGLILLGTLVEEFSSSREDIPAARKIELKKALVEQLPGVLSLVQGVLDTIFERSMLASVATRAPMPSPVNGAVFTGLASAAGFTESPDKFVRMARLDANSKQLATLALEILLQLFSWISLSYFVTPSLLATIFKFAALNDASTVALGTLAMSCINEMMGRSCIPRDFEEYLVQIFHNTFAILRDLTDDNPQKNGAGIEDLEDDYREKFTDFISVFLSQHVRRVEASSNFAMLDFLGQLFKYTFLQPQLDAFIACLDPWATFVGYLAQREDVRSGGAAGSADLGRYRDGLLSFVVQLLKKMLFKSNSQELSQVDDVNEDAEGHTEWDSFLEKATDVLGAIAELFPSETLDLLYPMLVEEMQAFSQVHTALEVGANSGERSAQWLCRMRDLRTLLRIFGRLVPIFEGSYEQLFASVQQLLQKFTELGRYMVAYKTFQAGPQLAKVATQLMFTLGSFTNWLSTYQQRSGASHELQAAYQALIVEQADLLCGVLLCSTNEQLSLVTADYLRRLASTVRPPGFASLPPIEKLVSSFLSSVPFVAVRNVIVQGITSAIVSPAVPVRDNAEWQTRAAALRGFLAPVVGPFKGLQGIVGFVEQRIYLRDDVKQMVSETIGVLSACVQAVQSEQKQSKSAVLDAIQDALPAVLDLLRVYLHETDVLSRELDFFLVLFDVLRVQLGPKFTSDTVGMLLGMLGSDHYMNAIMRGDAAAAEMLAKFVRLLKTLTDEPSKAFESSLPDIIKLVLDQLSPLIRDAQAAVVLRPPFFELVHSLLLNGWNFFFSPSAPPATQATCLAQFAGLLDTLAFSFHVAEADVFKQNLRGIEHLNATRRLYQRDVFKANLLFKFLETFLRVLINKSHDSLRDDIIITMYNMAAVDFDVFFARFLPYVLENIPDVTAEQRARLLADTPPVKDSPSFAVNIAKLVADTCYYRRLNNPQAGPIPI